MLLELFQDQHGGRSWHCQAQTTTEEEEETRHLTAAPRHHNQHRDFTRTDWSGPGWAWVEQSGQF